MMIGWNVLSIEDEEIKQNKSTQQDSDNYRRNESDVTHMVE